MIYVHCGEVRGESAPCKGVGEQIPTRFSCFFSLGEKNIQ